MTTPNCSAPARAPLFNSAEIPRGESSSLYAEFYAGDILSVHSDALIVSSFSGDYYPVPGSVLGAIADRFGLRYGAVRPDGTASVASNLHRFPTAPCAAFKELWVLEIKDISDQEPVTPGETRRNPEKNSGKHDGGMRAGPRQRPDTPQTEPAGSNDYLETSLTFPMKATHTSGQSRGYVVQTLERSTPWIA